MLKGLIIDLAAAPKSTRKEEEEANIDMDGQMYGAGIAD